jgi:hypothetical protein
MSQDISCPPQMRNGGLTPAHLSPFLATLSGLPHWLVPPQRTPELLPPESASWVATIAEAHFEVIISQRMISLYQESLAQYDNHAAHTQQVKAMQSAVLAKWQCQENATRAQALAEEASMHRRHNNNLHAITDGFVINLDLLVDRVVSWDGADNVNTLLAIN